MSGEQLAPARRADVQGLRALAVGLVVGYHFFPTTLPGGFVGVDVFFVISGYLITGLLLHEVERSGRISLLGFYGRRARRILPAALIVTIVTLIVSFFAFSKVAFLDVLTDAAWSSAYLANVHLANAPGGYFARTSPSLFTHFWSLAVEEQFYLVWPVLLLLIVVAAGRTWRRAALIAIVVIFVASILASVILSNTLPVFAFYSLVTRAWELAIGALLAVATLIWRIQLPRWLTETAGVFGAALILASAVIYTPGTQFPSFTAIVPTAGTALILWSGLHGRTVLGRALSWWPARRTGDVSYSLYLWHWPVLIFGLPLIGSSPFERVGLIAVALALAVATYLLVERPASKVVVTPGSARVLIAGLSATAAVVLSALVALAVSPTTGGPAVTSPTIGPTTATISDGRLVFAPDRRMTVPDSVPENVSPQLAGIPGDLADVFRTTCFSLQLQVCEGGDPDGSVSVVLAGDSQAGHWWPAVDRAATENGWKAYIVGMNGCPLADGLGNPDPRAAAELETACVKWQQEAPATIAALDPDVVLYASNVAGFQEGKPFLPEAEARWRAGVGISLDVIRQGDTRVVYFDKFPVLKQDPEACLFENLRDVGACSTARDWAVPPEISAMSADLAREHADVLFSPADLLCTDACAMLDGNHIMYRDPKHLTASYSQILTPVMAAVIDAALGLTDTPAH
ncbi:MAG: acyltransferase family protein [Pseudolysinimonas sp.]